MLTWKNAGFIRKKFGFGYVVFSKGICIEEKKIEIVKQ